MVIADVVDATGRLSVTFFNQPWREKQLRAGVQAVLFGKLEVFRGKTQMTNPVVDLVGDRTGKIIPVYPQSDKERIYTWEVARWQDEVLDRAGDFAEPMPDVILDRFDLVDRTAAFRSIHAPVDVARTWPRPGGGWSSTSCCASSSHWCCASVSSSGRRRGSVTRSAASWSSGSMPCCRSS